MQDFSYMGCVSDQQGQRVGENASHEGHTTPSQENEEDTYVQPRTLPAHGEPLSPSLNRQNRQEDNLLMALKMLLFESCRFHQRETAHERDVMRLINQLDQLWNGLTGAPEQKYEFLRARIQALFLWDRMETGRVQRNLFCPPHQLLDVFRQQRADRLRALPLGSLFFPAPAIRTEAPQLSSHHDANIHSDINVANAHVVGHSEADIFCQ